MHSNDVVDLQKFRAPDAAPEVPEGAQSQYLSAGTTLLVRQYIIDGYLNCGGFGITYTARDSLGRKVAIKECFPGEMVYRDGKWMKPRSPKYKKELAGIVRNFVTEAHSLANIKHDNIVHVHQIFEENSTAYLAMDFVDGPDLLDLLDSDRRLTAHEVETMTRALLDAIQYLHRIDMLHRDISPDNILVQRDGTPVLIDFGAARHVSKDDGAAPPPVKFVKDGYSPQEFYAAGRPQGPLSDLYSFAATLYHVITGAAPVDAQTRLAARATGGPDPYTPIVGTTDVYPPKFLKAIDSALALMPEDRLQSAQAWLDRIGPAPAATGRGLFKPVTAVLESLSIFEQTQKQDGPIAKRPRKALLAAGVAAAACLIGGVWTVSQRSLPDDALASVPLAIEATPPELRSLAALPEPAPLASVWPDGFAALRNTPAVDPTLSVNDANVRVSELPVPAVPGRVPQTTLAALDPPRLQTPPTGASTALEALPQPDAAIALAPIRPVLSGDALVRARPPQKAPITSLDRTGGNQLSSGPLDLALQSIAPVALSAPTNSLPAAPEASRPALDTRAPDYVAGLSDTMPLTASSEWDIELPFSARPPRVGDGPALVITEIKDTADVSRSADWLREGLILVGLNGAPLQEDTSLEDQIRDGLTITDEGTAQVTVFYRAPRADVLDTGMLVLPIVRRTYLADGTLLITRKDSDVWVTRVEALGAGITDLQVGDLIIGNASSPIRFTDHKAVETTFTALATSGITAAEFAVLRAGQRQTAAWRFEGTATNN
ncbi:MAG: protein kinase domain-containing protein [Paracoccaceae bacterium]